MKKPVLFHIEKAKHTHLALVWKFHGNTYQRWEFKEFGMGITGNSVGSLCST